MNGKPSPLAEEIFRTVSDSQDTAAVALLLSLLRQTSGLLQWLRMVTHDQEARSRLNGVMSGKRQPPPPHDAGRALLAWIANPAATTKRQKKSTESMRDFRRRYGGLTRSQVVGYIRHYQAGTIGYAPFLIACAWRHSPPDAEPSPALLQATALFLKEAITRDSPDLLRQLSKAASFFHETPIGKVTRERFGYPNWWKLMLFQYILTHPKPCYQVREFQQHLRGQKLAVEDKHIRTFCIKNHIARDMRPGRPRRVVRLS